MPVERVADVSQKEANNSSEPPSGHKNLDKLKLDPSASRFCIFMMWDSSSMSISSGEKEEDDDEEFLGAGVKCHLSHVCSVRQD